jgi:biopolymer transport protein TolR
MATSAEPNVVPLCDVLLVLLIIFMVITPMVQKGMDSKLPETSAEVGSMPAGVIVLTLQKDMTVLINQTPVEYAQLEAELTRLYSTRSSKTIFIRAYAKLPYGRIVELMDIAKGAGVDDIGIIPEYIEDE